MGLFGRLTNLFSQAGREDNLLKEALDLAEAKQPAKAIEIYDSLIRSSKSSTVRGRAQFNRALAYSAMKDDEKAAADLRAVVAMPDVPENVQNAARTQLVRIQNRMQRVQNRAQS